MGSRILGALWVTIGRPDQLGTDFVAQGARVGAVDLDQVASRVSDVKLDLATGQLVEVPTLRLAIVHPARAGLPENGFKVVHFEREVVVPRSSRASLKQVDLKLADLEPLHGIPEVGVSIFSAPKTSV